MRALDLTLYRPLGAADLLPWLLLAAMLLGGVGLGRHYLEQAEQISTLQQRIQRSIARAQPIAAPPATAAERQGYAKLQRVVAELADWPLDALDQLAAIKQPPVAILAIDVAGPVTQLTVETKDLTDLFEYWLQLHLLPQAAHVTLLQHSPHSEANYSTTRGVFRVQWRTAAS